MIGVAGDWIAYLDDIATAFRAGGTNTAVADVTLNTATAHLYHVNGADFPAAVDGGGAIVHGVNGLRFSRRVAGGVVSGSFTYPMVSYDHVFLESTGAAAGTVWNVSVTGSSAGEIMRLSYTNSAFAVIVKDPGGATLATLQFTSGNVYAITVWYDGTNVNVIDRSLHP